MGAESLDDEELPELTTGQAAGYLGVRPAFLRSLDAGELVRPRRSAGGHRRWSRRQLAVAARLRELFDEGLTLAAAAMVVTLQDEVAAVAQERDRVQSELDRTHRDLARVRRELDRVTGGAALSAAPTPVDRTRGGLTARGGSPARAHRAAGARSAHASPSTPTDITRP